MKPRTSFLTRSLALALALVLLVSSMNLGVALQVFAVENGETHVSAGELVANNYELTDAEKALLSSGMLAGETYSYTVPTDSELITVDTENATITADKSGKWTPTTAYIVADGEVVETITLVDGTGSYDPAVGNAFSVKVRYELTQEVDAAVQMDLLNTPAWIQTGLAHLSDAYGGSDTNLGTVVLALDTLKTLADGITMDFGAFTMSAKFGAEAAAAVYDLRAQASANGGTLDMQDANTAYNTSAYKVQYLLESGEDYKETLIDTYESLLAIKNDGLANNTLLDEYLLNADNAAYTKWMAFKSILGSLVAALEPLAAADWTAAEMGTDLINAATVDYAELNELVFALDGLTDTPEIVNPLLMAETTIQKNLSMYNVYVSVVLEYVKDNEVVDYATKTTTLTLAEGATAEEIAAAVEAAGIKDSALTEWANIYVEEHYEVSETALPTEGLYADLDYTITYSPKNYTVTFSYADEMVVPYGYKVTLPVHEDPAKAYDYVVNGEPYAQGMTVTIEGDTTITRSSGKAYATTDLYAVVADNYGNEAAQAILKSGALKGNSVINVRKPDPADAASLLTLIDGVLTAEGYDAAYNNLSWAPYTYGAEGTENRFDGNTASWTGKSVKVQYILKLTNFSTAEVDSVLKLAETLKAEAEAQKATLDAFASNKAAMGQLDKVKLGALNGVIDVTDFTPGDGTDTDAANLEMRAYFKGLVSGIIGNNLDADGYLKIYNMLGEYETDGLKYYYESYAAFIAEIESLAGYLHGMLEDSNKVAALEIMVGAAGFPEYAEKIVDLESKLAQVLEDLSAPNESIDLRSENLGKLLTALTAEEAVSCHPADTAYLMSETLTALDESQVMVQVIIDTPKGGATVTSAEMEKGTVLTQAVINDLKAKVDAKVAELLGENAKFYTLTVEGTALDALVGTELTANVNTYYNYAATEYTVEIDGEADQTVTIEDLEINLPKHPTQGWTYEYTIDGVEAITSSTYTFTAEQLERLFVGGTYTITRKAINSAVIKLEGMIAALNEAVGKDDAFTLVSEGGVYTGIVGNIAAGDMMNFVMGLVDSGYSYIGLNGEGFIYLNAENTLEISLQTLINAVLNDEDFNNQTVINLAENGKGKLLSAVLQLDEAYTDLDFTLNLTSVPEQLTNNADLVKTVSNYIKFQSNEGVMDVSVNLPDQVYGAYAAALIATGNVDKTDVNELTQKVTIQFVYDYLTAVTGSEADMVTFTNTLKMLGLSQDLTGYNNYYNKGISAYNTYVDVNISDDGAAIDVSAPGQKSINALLKLAGIDTSSLSTYLAMIKEYKDGGVINASILGTVANVDKTYYALIVDAQADGVTNKFEAPSSTASLRNETSTLAGYSAIILLDDVQGDLTIGGTTVLDLNGKSVSGNINATGKLYIIDSSMDTYEAGTVGSVSGNAVVIGGNYNADVSAYLKDGYYMDGTTVRNTLYYITDKDSEVTVILDANVEENGIPNVKALAVDIASDLVLNYIYTAKLDVNGYELIDVQINDVLGIVADRDVNNLAKQLLACVTIGEAGYENKVGFEGLVNEILDDLLDFETISNGLKNNEALATYEITTEPWEIELDHVTDGNYMTVNVTSNDDLVKNFKVSLVVESKYNDALAALTGELANIVEDRTDIEVDIPTPTYSDKTLSIVGAGKAEAYVDMSKNSDYAVMIGVVLAYGNEAKREAVAAAINSGEINDLKAVVDGTSVKELFTALKVMARNVNFQAMADAVGVTADVASAAELEAIYHVVLCGAGKVLEQLDITGMDSKLGRLYNAETGYYELTKENMFRDAELNVRSYTALVELTVDVLSLNVKLFAEETCMIGDVNHDEVIDVIDAGLIQEYLAEMDPAVFCFRGADVNGDGEITVVDAGLMREYLAEIIEEFPAESK